MKAQSAETGNPYDRLNLTVLRVENACRQGTGGRSQENAHVGFLPAFRDRDTGIIYRSRFGDGREAPFHLLDGLPDQLVVKRSRQGRVVAVKSSVISGFLRANLFYTREQAMAATMPVNNDA
jgi:hypothetical protein